MAVSGFAATTPIIVPQNSLANSYVAEFPAGTPDAQAVANALISDHPGATLIYCYQYALKGMAFVTNDVAVAEAINSDARVILTAHDTDGGTISADTPWPGWALDRIDQHPAQGNNRYFVSSRAGRGVTIYVLDSGISDLHGEWGYPSRLDRTFFKYKSIDSSTSDAEITFDDDYVFDAVSNGQPIHVNGHGTQVASIAAGDTFGVARGANVRNVKVTGSRPTTRRVSSAIAGIDAVFHDFTTRNPNWHPGGRCYEGYGIQTNPAVANMSISFPKYAILDDAVMSLIGAGVTVVTGAGNNGTNSVSNLSPANLGELYCGPLVVGATMTVSNVDRRATFGVPATPGSNYGPAVHIWAPGKDVSAVNGRGDVDTFTGTSAAAPYVSGAVAKLLGDNTGAPFNPDTVATIIVNAATSNAIQDDLSGAFNKLLYIAPTTPAVKGDFDGDGKADIVWRNAVSGADALWLMNGTAFTGNVVNLPTLQIPKYAIVGAADFDGDGHEDLLWRNSSSGDVAIWLLNGTSVEVVNVATLSNLDYYIGGVADFNGDGSPDILWRNGVSGANAVWLMNKTKFTYSVVDLLALPGSNFVFEGAADFNNDGSTDIFIRNYAPNNGNNAIWLMNGTTYGSTLDLGGIPNTDYHLAGVADYNNDGTPDILWHNTVTVANAVWLMAPNGTISSVVNLPFINNPDYVPAGPR